MTTTRSHAMAARPTKPGSWLVLLFIFVSGMAFSSSAETDRARRSPATMSVASGAGTVSLQAVVPAPTRTLLHDDTSAEPASLAFLGIALIGAAGFWRRVLRRRQQLARSTVAPAPSPASHLRAVPRPRMAS